MSRTTTRRLSRLIAAAALVAATMGSTLPAAGVTSPGGPQANKPSSPLFSVTTARSESPPDPARLLADVGPCDDDCYLYINGTLVVSTGLNETRVYRRNLPDGAYNFRLEVKNSGRWAWRAKLNLVINGITFAAVDTNGGSGLYDGTVYEQEWQAQIKDGKLTEF
jgi:hypothetical protein